MLYLFIALIAVISISSFQQVSFHKLVQGFNQILMIANINSQSNEWIIFGIPETWDIKIL